MKQSGFTLVELLIALAILSLLIGTAAPGLGELYENQQRLTAARELASGIRAARVAAISRNQKVTIQAIDQDWSYGWQIIAEHNAGRPDGPLLVERTLDGRVRIVGNSKVAEKLSFSGLGGLLGAANGTLHVCQPRQTSSDYQVIVAITGQVRLAERRVEHPPCG